MNSEELENLLEFLTNVQNNYDFGDNEVMHLCNELKKLENELPTFDKLEEIRRLEVDLETKYECFYELNNYFDPFYISMKKKIHDVYVRNLREENRKK